jgi:predicted metalloprotease with PDZ domain
MDPYSWQQENYYEELWIAEGGTSYYGGILLLRAGLKTPAEYITDLPKAVKDDRQRPGNLQQSLVECSFDAWTKFWKDNEQSFNSESNYYGKGANVCLLLDLEIRHQTKNRHSLDDVFRDLYKRFPLGSGGYTVDDFQRSAEAQGSGSLASFFDNYIRGVHPLPWEETFLYAGLELSPDGPTEKPFLGITASDRGNIPQITRVVKGSCAYDAGLNAGDELVALNGSKVRASDVNKRIKQMKAGDTVTVTVFRENLLRNFSFSLRNAPTYEYTVQKVKKPSSLQKSIYESWLSTEWTKE